MAKRWKMSPKETGLAAVCAGPRCSYLSEDGSSNDYLASVNYSNSCGGWYWVCPKNDELGIPWKNTCNNTVDTAKEAKHFARKYVDLCIKEKELSKCQ